MSELSLSGSGSASDLDPVGLLRSLLPRFYWPADEEAGRVLEALLDAIATQYGSLYEQIETLYEDVFLETCAERLVPYFGEEVGVTGLAAVNAPGHSLRSWVGQLLGFRRRKGTLATLARGCGAASGWATFAQPGHAGVACTQTVTNPNLLHGRFIDVRELDLLAALRAPWTTTTRTVSVAGTPVVPGRPVLHAEQGPQNLGRGPGPLLVDLFVWRLESYPVTRRTPTEVPVPGAAPRTTFTFHPFGVDTQLFRVPATPSDERQPPGAAELPLPVTREELAVELGRTGPADRSAALPLPFQIRFPRGDGTFAPIESHRIAVADLEEWTPPRRPGTEVFVDPVLGRMQWVRSAPAGMLVDYAHGFSGELGGGTYAIERQWRDADVSDRLLRVSQTAGDQYYPTVEAALAAVSAGAHAARSWCLRIEDSGTYTAPNGGWELDLAAGTSLSITTLPGTSPVLGGDLRVNLGKSALVSVTGLLISGRLVSTGSGSVLLAHSTLDPRLRPSIQANAKDGPLSVAISNAIIGPISAGPAVDVSVQDSIVDGGDGTAIGDPATPVERADLTRVTVLGETHAETLVGDQSLFVGRTVATSPQSGLVQDSYLGPQSEPPTVVINSATDGVLGSDRPPGIAPKPLFTSKRYGAPGYCQLLLDADPIFRCGGEDGSELGAFSLLQQPARAARLARIAQEFLPAELAATVKYRT